MIEKWSHPLSMFTRKCNRKLQSNNICIFVGGEHLPRKISILLPTNHTLFKLLLPIKHKK